MMVTRVTKCLETGYMACSQEAFYVSHYKPYQSPLLGDHTTYCFVLVNDETGFAISLINKRYLINVYSFVTLIKIGVFLCLHILVRAMGRLDCSWKLVSIHWSYFMGCFSGFLNLSSQISLPLSW